MGKGSRLLSPISSCSGKRQYKGVRMRSWGSWVSEIRTPHQKKRIWLGSYATPEAAARAYDAALLCLKGSSASFNFPASLPCHSVAATVMSPKSIQRVAAAAAAANANASTSPTLNATAASPPCSLPSPTSSTITEKLDDEEDQTWIQLGALQSPKCADHGINPLASPWEELEEWGDLNLWSFR